MMALTVETCPQCGAPASANRRKCEYCKSEFFISDLSQVAGKSSTEVQKYVSFYKSNIAKDDGDADSVTGLGLCYLQLKLFKEAAQFLEKGRDLAPERPSTYFYLAMAIMGRKRPKILSRTDVQKVEELLEAAISLDSDYAAAHALLAIVRHDYYELNGLRCPGTPPAALVGRAKTGKWARADHERMVELNNYPDNEYCDLLIDLRAIIKS